MNVWDPSIGGAPTPSRGGRLRVRRNPDEIRCSACLKSFGRGRALYVPAHGLWFHEKCFKSAVLPPGTQAFKRQPTAESLARFADFDARFRASKQPPRENPDEDDRRKIRRGERVTDRKDPVAWAQGIVRMAEQGLREASGDHAYFTRAKVASSVKIAKAHLKMLDQAWNDVGRFSWAPDKMGRDIMALRSKLNWYASQDPSTYPEVAGGPLPKRSNPLELLPTIAGGVVGGTTYALVSPVVERIMGRRMNPQDDEIRRLERAAAQGDRAAKEKLYRLRLRAGGVSRWKGAVQRAKRGVRLSREMARKVALLPERTRSLLQSDGTFPNFTSFGSYTILYMTRDGSYLCGACAGKLLREEDDSTVHGLQGDVYYEGPAVNCDDCDRLIDSSYGDPDAEGSRSNPRRVAARRRNFFAFVPALATGAVGGVGYELIGRPVAQKAKGAVQGRRTNPALSFARLDQADAFAWALRSQGYRAEVVTVGALRDALHEVETNAPRSVIEPLLRRVTAASSRVRQNPDQDLRAAQRAAEQGDVDALQRIWAQAKRTRSVRLANWVLNTSSAIYRREGEKWETPRDEALVGIMADADEYIDTIRQRLPKKHLRASWTAPASLCMCGVGRDPNCMVHGSVAQRMPTTKAALLSALRQVYSPRDFDFEHAYDVGTVAELQGELRRARSERSNPRRRANPLPGMATLMIVGNKPRRMPRPDPRRRSNEGADFVMKLPKEKVLGTMPLSEARAKWSAVSPNVSAFVDFHKSQPNDEVILYDDGKKEVTVEWVAGTSPEVTYGGHGVPDGSVKSFDGGKGVYVHKTRKDRPTYLTGNALTDDFSLLGGMKSRRGWLRG